MAITASARQQIEGALAEHRVVLFMKGNKHFPQCGFSARVLKILKETGVPFHTVNVLSDPEIRDGIKEFSDWPTIPQLYVDKEFLGGCDIVTEMFEAGELQGKLGAAPAAPVAAPRVTISEAAAGAFRQAAEGDDVLHLGIDADFQYELYFGPKEANEIEAKAEGSGFLVYFSRQSAARANGLSIDYVQAQGQGAFRIDNPNEPPRVKSLQVEELKKLIDSGESFQLIDVRRPEERQRAELHPSARLLDDQVAVSLSELPKDTKLVFHCHHGGRSRAAAERFVQQGFRNVFNVEGGIDAWSLRVDPSVARY